jgi:hypothetical protein
MEVDMVGYPAFSITAAAIANLPLTTKAVSFVDGIELRNVNKLMYTDKMTFL